MTFRVRLASLRYLCASFSIRCNDTDLYYVKLRCLVVYLPPTCRLSMACAINAALLGAESVGRLRIDNGNASPIAMCNYPSAVDTAPYY